MDKDNNLSTAEHEYKETLHKYKLQRWHSWWWLCYFTMYSLIQFIQIAQGNVSEAFTVSMAIMLPIMTILSFGNANIVITLFGARLEPLLLIKFPKYFADEIWNQVYTRFYHPTTLIFTWITIITSVVYPIYLAVHYDKWWTWLIYIVILIINIFLILFTVYNLSELSKAGKKIYNLYEGDKNVKE